ncbi:intein C-terminal splicing region domain protein [Microscilla marina ATCC 23134]|uniref:Intein C-terminal splicing region domain protein n=1 Tax=Microscilla marina ATCC 23134 TaxID=313606 RepID=A2A0G4_MICM2|nr:intein C-terminal splicing region domain protein [Microscilla marina ATCC 23134]
MRVAFREGEKKIYRADLEDVTTDKQQGFEYKEVIISSDPTSASNHVAKLTSTEPLGMLRNLEVSKGDVVKVKVKGYYAGGSVTHNNAVNWGLTLGQVNGHAKSGEISTENTPFLLNLGLSITPNNGGNNPNASVPSGYLKLVFYKKDGTPVTASLQIAHLSPGAGQWQDLELTYTATERGYLQAFVANESDQEVFFDDMVVEHTPQLIVQENHYYPFGLELEGLSKHGKPEHRWKFQGQEEQKEFGLNWSQFKWRNADVALGRFFSVDPLAEDYLYNSTYAFSENNVTGNRELEGLEKTSPVNPFYQVLQNTNTNPTKSTAAKRQNVAHSDVKNFVKSRVGGAMVGFSDSQKRLKFYKPRVARLEARYKAGKISAGQYAMGRYNAQKKTKIRQSAIGRTVGNVRPFGKPLAQQKALAEAVAAGEKPLSKNAFKTRKSTTRLSKISRGASGGFMVFAAALSVENVVKSDNKVATTVQEIGGWTAAFQGTKAGALLGEKIGTPFGPYGKAVGAFVLGTTSGSISYFYGTEWIKSLQNTKVERKEDKVWHQSKQSNNSSICFVAGTQILMADGSNKKIENVKVGDTVKTVNMKTFELENQKVLMIDSPIHDDIIDINFTDGTKNSNTFDHPYYVEGKGWCSYKPSLTKERYGLDTKQLAEGDMCYKFSNNMLTKVIVSSIKENIRKEQTYNLSHISNTHNFFANGILVHNKILNPNEHSNRKK